MPQFPAKEWRKMRRKGCLVPFSLLGLLFIIRQEKKRKEVMSMEEFMDVVPRYAYIVVLGLQLLLTVMILRVAYNIRKTNRSILEIRNKVAGYLEVILEDTEAESEEGYRIPKQEELMRASIENHKKQQREAVFEAVLEEIFP